MLPNRYVTGPSSLRKSRLDGKQSLIPKPRGSGSTDRLSSEIRRPSNAGYRSSSAEPPRGTFGARLSREASAIKLSYNGRARSQTGDSRYGQASMTPLRTTPSMRKTNTPRTPTDDPRHSWKTTLERALSFVTVKDQRPISNPAWQRAEYTRVVEALAERGMSGNTALVRPLTITQFVNIVGNLLGLILKDVKLNNDNYVTKLPHLCKRLLYPGAISKSWLKTVNTLHAFPQALALIAYLLELVNHFERPINEEWLYVAKDEKSQLLRDYLTESWIRFQEPECQFDDLNENYLKDLKVLLKYDEEEHLQLQREVAELEAKYNEDEEADKAEQTKEACKVERRNALVAELRAVRPARAASRTEIETKISRIKEYINVAKETDIKIERAKVELKDIEEELENQSVTLTEREALLNEVDYKMRVVDSKEALVEQINKMVLSKETELALWQNRTLDSCMQYKQELIHMSAQFPALQHFVIDEIDLRSPECAAHVAAAVEALREEEARLVAKNVEQARTKAATITKRDELLKSSHARIIELKSWIEREQQSAAAALSSHAAEAAARADTRAHRTARFEQLTALNEEVQSDLAYWEEQDSEWKTRLAEMKYYIEEQKVLSQELKASGQAKRVQLVRDMIKRWNLTI